MKWIIRLYSVILLGYTGWRTFDFMSSNLPKSDISFWLSIAFLFATEIGLVLWHELHLKHTTTDTQDKLSFALTWIDFVGSLAAGIADMILRQTFIDGYVIPVQLAQFLIFGLPCIMAVNVAGVILFEQNDATTLEMKAEKSANFAIHAEAMKQIHASREELANEKADVIYSRIRGRVTGKIDGAYGQSGPVHRIPRPERRPSLIGRLVGKLTSGINEKIEGFLGDNDAARQGLNATAFDTPNHLGDKVEGQGSGSTNGKANGGNPTQPRQ